MLEIHYLKGKKKIRLQFIFGEQVIFGEAYIAILRTGKCTVLDMSLYKLMITQILKIQAISALVIMVAGAQIFAALGITDLYLPLLKVQLVATALQVVFLAIINVFCYLDQRRMLVLLTGLFFVLNVIFTGISLYLGPQFFGFGFLLSLAVCVMLGLWLVSRKMGELEYSTFMLH